MGRHAFRFVPAVYEAGQIVSQWDIELRRKISHGGTETRRETNQRAPARRVPNPFADEVAKDPGPRIQPRTLRASVPPCERSVSLSSSSTASSRPAPRRTRHLGPCPTGTRFVPPSGQDK